MYRSDAGDTDAASFTIWFHVPFAGSYMLLYMMILLFLLSCVGIGLTISALSNTMQQVMVYCFAIMMPMILLSGLATPVRNMPVWLQYATYINPFRFAIEAIRRIYLEGAPFLLLSTIVFLLFDSLYYNAFGRMDVPAYIIMRPIVFRSSIQRQSLSLCHMSMV